MIVRYDEANDTLRIVFSESQVFESDEVSPGFVFDYDKDGNPVSLEVLDASRRVTNPHSIEVRASV